MVQPVKTKRVPSMALLTAGFSATCFALFVMTSATSADCVPTWDEGIATANLSGLSTEVHAFTVFDDGTGAALYAAGSFTSVAGQSAGSFARWDGEQWTGLASGFTNTTITSLEVFDDGSGPAIYAGGGFTSIGGESISQIARYDHVNDTWESVGGGLNFDPPFGVVALAVVDNGLYAVGEDFLDTAVMRWNGNQWTTIGGSSVVGPWSAVAHDGDLYIGGLGSAGGAVDQWDGNQWTLVGDGIGTNVFTLASFDGDLYAGTSCSAGDDISQCVHRWEGGTDWSGVAGSESFQLVAPTSPGPGVRTLNVADDGTGPALYAGGQMVSNDPDAAGVARFDGTDWTPLGFGVYRLSGGEPAGIVQAVFGFDDGSGQGVYVGGDFDFAENGDAFASRGIARWGCFDPVTLEPVDPDESNLLATDLVISSFGGTTSITVQPRNADGDLLAPGRDVVINTTAGNLIGNVEDLGDGTYRQVLEAVPGPAGAVVTATADSVSLTASIFISFVPVDPVLSSIVVAPAEVFEGDVAQITVTPRDDGGAPVGSGFDVNIATTHGELAGEVSDNGDGTYTQTFLATSVGTASISVTVDGLPLQNTGSLTVIDPANFGQVVGVDAVGDFIGYSSIQEAINNSDDDELAIIFISSGTYEETVQIDGRSGLELVGLSAVQPVVVRGFVLSDSDDIHLRAITVDATGGPHDGIRMSGGQKKNDNIEIVDLLVTGATMNGIRIDRDNENILIENSVIIGNGRNGVDCHLSGFNYALIGNTISENGHNGVSIGRDVVILLQENIITGNGVAGGNGGGRYGIDRQRKAQDGTPEDVTVIQNVIENNNGRTHDGRADENINNYDQIFDASDDQSPYTD